jgi:hypothetical protein
MKKTTTFKRVRYVGWETSMSPIVEREKKTMEYTIEWYKESERGWFEIYDEESGGEDYYAEGGLEFDGNKLTDYDGVFSLDDEVLKCLKEWGADVSEMEELLK